MKLIIETTMIFFLCSTNLVASDNNNGNKIKNIKKTNGSNAKLTKIKLTKKNNKMEEKKYTRPSDEKIKKKLSDIQWKVTQKDGTERPFSNEYWDNKSEGIYVDIVSGEPLFSSTHKYKSGTGWPSFYEVITKNNIVEKTDRKLFSSRTEIRSKHGDSHLGHVFKDGPEPTGLRYCMNSAAMKFIPKEKMKEEGYEKLLVLFEKDKE